MSLPDGASPLTINCDYNLGEVFQRPGKESAFTYGNAFFTSSAKATVLTGTGAAWAGGSVSLSTAAISAQLLQSGTGFANSATFLDAIVNMTLHPNTFVLMIASGYSNTVNINNSLNLQEFQLFSIGIFFAGEADQWLRAFYCYSGAGGACVFNATSAGLDGGYGLIVLEYSGVQSVSVQDGNNTNFSQPASKPLTGSINTTSTDLIVTAALTVNSNPTVDPGFSFVNTVTFTNPGGANVLTVGHNTSAAPGTYQGGFSPNSNSWLAAIGALKAIPTPSQTQSQTLNNLNFGLVLPVNTGNTNCGCGCSTTNLPLFGVEVILTGNQTSQDPSAFLKVQLKLADGTLSPTSFNVQLPSSTGTVIVGSPTEMWGLALTAALLNDPNFTVLVTAYSQTATPTTFNLTVAVEIKAASTPNPPPDFNYLKTFSQTDGDLFSLALGSDGTIYQEDVLNLQSVLTPVYSAILPESFAESCTVDDREFIAISNLLNGTDIPYTYNGTNFDRLSQVGPGAPPTAATSTATTNIVSITQPPVMSDALNPGHLSGILWSNGPGSTAPGNVLTVYYTTVAGQPLADPNLQPGVGVTIAGVDVPGPNQNFNGQPVDGNYTVVAIGQGIPPGAQFSRWYFTVTMPSIQSVNQANHIESHAPFGTYQVTTATLTAAQQVANVEVGTTIQVAGTGGAPPAGYDGSWVVTTTPNASQLQITSTSLNGNVATYAYNLVTGTAPTVGQKVTVTGTLNGNGIFNVVQGVISSASPGTFSIQLTGPNLSSVAESGSGIIFGTIFTFEPGQPVGSRLGGTIVTVGIISAGVRKVCYSFLTRNGYMTAPSPITTFDVPSGASVLTIGNLASGPANVIARVVHLTAANGGNFYNIPIPVTVLSNGVNVINSSTYVNDNTSRSVNLSFSDGVLLAANAIDIQGNNLFATLELGSVLGLIGYASRVFAIGEQNKVPNFLNWSFDGGYLDPSILSTTIPLGWTQDPTFGGGGSLVNSPVFGFAYQIQNVTGSTQATYGMITQPAFQDEFLVPIIRPSTQYSTRITAAVTAGGGSGSLVVDLYSPSFAKSFGLFSVPLASLTGRMAIFTGTMLTQVLAPVPNDLLLRIYATAIPNGTTILIDRNEPFPTEEPNLSTQVAGSYVNNFEAFDESGEGGIVDTAGENQQAVRSAFELYDTLYLVKTGSLVSTQDNASTEPSGWSLRTVSNSVGTPSIYGVTTSIDEPNAGEAWAVIAGQPGGFIFFGGEPIKITEEIQSLWNYINWAYGHTLWVKNDINRRRIYFAVPLKTPNPWLPTGIIPDDSNPTTPNVILMLSYRQLNTGEALAGKVGVHVSYSGRLIASELTRKWSIWTIKAPAAAFLQRADNTQPLFLGNSDDNGKIFDLDEDGDLCGQDDCSAMTQIYDTYGFVTDEQAQGLRLGSVRKIFSYMAMIVEGMGNLNLRVFPNTLDSQFAHDLLPTIPLPLMSDGDIEVPVNETANRLFVQFKTNQIGSCFRLSRLMMAMGVDPWSPVRGKNY